MQGNLQPLHPQQQQEQQQLWPPARDFCEECAPHAVLTVAESAALLHACQCEPVAGITAVL
jgi:hypothetical protein